MKGAGSAPEGTFFSFLADCEYSLLQFCNKHRDGGEGCAQKDQGSLRYVHLGAQLLMRSLLAYYYLSSCRIRKKCRDGGKRPRREDLGSLLYVSRRASLTVPVMCMSVCACLRPRAIVRMRVRVRVCMCVLNRCLHLFQAAWHPLCNMIRSLERPSRVCICLRRRGTPCATSNILP